MFISRKRLAELETKVRYIGYGVESFGKLHGDIQAIKAHLGIETVYEPGKVVAKKIKKGKK